MEQGKQQPRYTFAGWMLKADRAKFLPLGWPLRLAAGQTVADVEPKVHEPKVRRYLLTITLVKTGSSERRKFWKEAASREEVAAMGHNMGTDIRDREGWSRFGVSVVPAEGGDHAAQA